MERYRAALERGDPDFIEDVKQTLEGLDDEVRENLEAAARPRGRTLLEQALYELRAGQGLCPVDEGDTRTAEWCRLQRGMRRGRPLQG
jgi:hypothetical protein